MTVFTCREQPIIAVNLVAVGFLAAFLIGFLLVRETSCLEMSLLWYDWVDDEHCHISNYKKVCIYTTSLFYISILLFSSPNIILIGNLFYSVSNKLWPLTHPYLETLGHSPSPDHCRSLPHAPIPQTDWLRFLVLYSCNSRSHQNIRTIPVIITKWQRKKHSKFSRTNHNDLRLIAPTPPISSCVQAKCIRQNVKSLSK